MNYRIADQTGYQIVEQMENDNGTDKISNDGTDSEIEIVSNGGSKSGLDGI